MTPEMKIAKLEQEIEAAETARYHDEMSDDYCYSNGKYQAHTDRINQMKRALAALKAS